MDEETQRTIEMIVGVVAAIVIGPPMLLFGRRLFWLLGGLAMALVGLVIAAFIVGVVYGGDVSFNFDDTYGIRTTMSPEAQRNTGVVVPLLIILTLAGAIIGGLLLIRFPKVAAGIVGFTSGPYFVLLLFELYSINIPGWLSGLLTIVTGVISAVIAWRNPDTSLIVLSTLIGANLIVTGLRFDLNTPLSAMIWIGLMLLGIIYQTSAFHRRQAKSHAALAKQ